VRWFFLWLAAALSTGLGLSIAYLGPSSAPGGKGSALASGIIGLPLPLVLLGLAGLVCSVAGILWTRSRVSARAAPDEGPGAMAARLGLALAVIALAGEIFFVAGISTVPGSALGAPGVAGIIPAVGFAAWPVALAATLLSWPAAIVATGRRRTALWDLILGSLTLVWLPAWFLRAAFGLSGGD